MTLPHRPNGLLDYLTSLASPGEAAGDNFVVALRPEEAYALVEYVRGLESQLILDELPTEYASISAPMSPKELAATYTPLIEDWIDNGFGKAYQFSIVAPDGYGLEVLRKLVGYGFAAEGTWSTRVCECSKCNGSSVSSQRFDIRVTRN